MALAEDQRLSPEIEFIRLVRAVAVIGLVFVLYWAFSKNPSMPQGIDGTGYISHRVESPITADPSWLIGETETCVSRPLDRDNARILNKPTGYALWGLNCGGSEYRRMPVTFWGSEVQSGIKAAYWDCTRAAESFTCKQTSAN